MTVEKMKEFVGSRIDLISKGQIHDKIPKINGVLVHVIPQNQELCKPIDWNNDDANHKFILKNSFRRFSDLKSIYIENADGILSVNPDREFYYCFHNGIIETFRSPISVENQFVQDGMQLKIDNIFYQIGDTLDAAKNVHEKIYKSSPPYYIFVTLLGVGGALIYSVDRGYSLVEGFPSRNGRFEPFVWNNMNNNIMPEIKEGIHSGITASAKWNRI